MQVLSEIEQHPSSSIGAAQNGGRGLSKLL